MRISGNGEASIRPGAFVVAMVLVLTALLPPVPAGGTGGEGAGGARAYTPHDPIVITKDSEFTAANGVTGGGSSYSDPYIISGWEFSPSGKDAVKITMTMMSFKIMNCKFKNAAAGYSGISITSVDSMGYITRNEFDSNDIGIKMDNWAGGQIDNNTFNSNTKAVVIDSVSLPVQDNTFTGGQVAISMNSANTARVCRNSFSGVGTGIAVEKKASGTNIHDNSFQSCTVGISHSAVANGEWPDYEDIFNNTFTGTTTGMKLSGGTTNVRIYNNEFNGGSRGVEVSSSNSNYIFENLFAGISSYAVHISGSTGNYVSRNNFMNNNGGSSQAFCDGPDNSWGTTNDYENWWNKQSGKKGNHWSDRFIPDEDRDGFTDQPYSISGSTCKDSYALTTIVPYAGLQGKPLSATVIVEKSSGAAPLAAVFIPDVAGGLIPFSYSWQFGDGGTSGIAFPSHTYTAAGTYQAKFTVTDQDGKTATSPTLAMTVTGGGGQALTATASADKSDGAAPLAVTFTGSASGGTAPYAYSWNFGDGQTGAGASVSHTYNTAGTYSAICTATDNAAGSAQAPAVIIAVTGGAPTFSASAISDKASGQAPLAVTFTGSAAGGTQPYTYSWNFGDGQSGTGTSVSHTYGTAGTYSAVLTVSDSNGQSKQAAAVTITVTSSGGSGGLKVSASASPDSGQEPLKAFFVCTASGGIGPYTYSWKFGDGATGAGATIAHTYEKKGNYTAEVTVRDSAGDQMTGTIQIEVKQKAQVLKPQPGFEGLLLAAAIAAGLAILARKRESG